MHYFKGARENRLPPGRPQEHINPYKLGVFLWDIGKLYRPRSDAAKRGILSGSPLTDTVCLPNFLFKFEINYTTQHPLKRKQIRLNDKGRKYH